MSAGRYNFSIERGASFIRTIMYMDPDDIGIDLAGAEVRMQIRDNYSSTEPAIDANSTNGGIIKTGNPGEFTINLTPELTGAVSFNQGVYDVEVEYADGTVERILEGRVKIVRQVTQ